MQIEKGFTDNWFEPTGAQERLMRQYAGCKRFVWNRALSIEQARRNNPDPHSNFLKDAPVHALQCVLYELYDSYQRFFRGEQAHPPQFKKRSKAKVSFTESDPASFEIDEASTFAETGLGQMPVLSAHRRQAKQRNGQVERRALGSIRAMQGRNYRPEAPSQHDCCWGLRRRTPSHLFGWRGCPTR